MRRPLLALAISLGLASAVAPAANAAYKVPKTEPPSCTTTIGNVVLGDPACEPTDLQP